MKKVSRIVLLLALLAPVFAATEVSRGKIRFTPDDPMLAQMRVTKGSAAFTQRGEWVYFFSSPFDTEPWKAFEQPAVQPPAQLPAGFKEIFGERPVSLGAAAGWDQELRLWRDAKRPDWVDDALAAVAQAVWEHYTLGIGTVKSTFRFMPYRLTNGAEKVFFPDADQRAATTNAPQGLVVDARLVYTYPIYGLMGYQADLIQAGVVIPENRLVEFLKFGKQVHSVSPR